MDSSFPLSVYQPHCPSLHRSDKGTVSALLKGLIRWLKVYTRVHELPRPYIKTIGYVNEIQFAFNKKEQGERAVNDSDSDGLDLE